MSDIEVQEHEEAIRAQQMEEAMEADGVSVMEPVQQSYFGFAETHRCILPDGVSYVEHQTLNEGERKKYQNSINREVAIKRSTQDAVMKMAAGDERHALLRAAIVGWNLVDQNGQPIPFTKQETHGRTTNQSTLDRFLNEAPPKVIDLIHKEVQKANPWLMGEMSVDDIKQQIEDLEEMLKIKQNDEEGKDS